MSRAWHRRRRDRFMRGVTRVVGIRASRGELASFGARRLSRFWFKAIQLIVLRRFQIGFVRRFFNSRSCSGRAVTASTATSRRSRAAGSPHSPSPRTPDSTSEWSSAIWPLPSGNSSSFPVVNSAVRFSRGISGVRIFLGVLADWYRTRVYGCFINFEIRKDSLLGRSSHPSYMICLARVQVAGISRNRGFSCKRFRDPAFAHGNWPPTFQNQGKVGGQFRRSLSMPWPIAPF